MKVKELIEELKKHSPELEAEYLKYDEEYNEYEAHPINLVQRYTKFGAPTVLLMEKKISVID